MNSFDLNELKDTAKDAIKTNPVAALFAVALSCGVAKGLATGIPKLGQNFENCWKYAVDKVLSKPEQHLSLIDDDQQQDDSIAA